MYKFIFIFILLLYASYLDLKYRKVSNKYWLMMLIFSLPFIVYTNISIYILLLCFALMFIFGYIFFKFNLFGAADIKCFLVLSLLIGIKVFFVFYCSYMFFVAFLLGRYMKIKQFKGEYPFIPFILLGYVFVNFI